MNDLTRFDPFSGLTRFDPLGDFDDMFKGFTFKPVLRGMEAEPQMKIDVSEEDKSYLR